MLNAPLYPLTPITAAPVSPWVTICATSLTAPRFAEMLPAGIEPAGIDPAGRSAAASGCSALVELSTPVFVSSIGMLPAGMLPAGFDRTPCCAGLLSARSRSVPSPGTLRYAVTFVFGGRLSSGKRKKSTSLEVAMWPTIRVFLSIVGAEPGESFGSQFWVTSTGAWSSAEYVPSLAMTPTLERCVPSVRPA